MVELWAMGWDVLDALLVGSEGEVESSG